MKHVLAVMDFIGSLSMLAWFVLGVAYLASPDLVREKLGGHKTADSTDPFGDPKPPLANSRPDDAQPHGVKDYLAQGWKIQAVATSPLPVLVLEKGAQAVYCTMKDERVEIKGVPQLLTASCAVIR